MHISLYKTVYIFFKIFWPPTGGQNVPNTKISLKSELIAAPRPLQTNGSMYLFWWNNVFEPRFWKVFHHPK